MTTFTLPSFIALPIARFVMTQNIRKQGAQSKLLVRKREKVESKIQTAFDELWKKTITQGPNALIEYNLPYSKISFLNYLCDEKNLVAHGSNLENLEVLNPIRKSKDLSEFGNRKIIFASPDANWAMWFAIMDKNKVDKTSNASLRVGGINSQWTKLYYFMIPSALKDHNPFCDGMIYILKPESFPQRHRDTMTDLLGLEIEEWGCADEVQPIARIKISPSDFAYLNDVQFVL